MSETEYINATNLARVRDMQAIARSLSPGGIVPDETRGDLDRVLFLMADLLNRHVKVRS